MTRIGCALLLAVALPAGAQQAPAEPAKAPPPPTQEERRPLNLKLDNPSSFATIAPAEKPQPALPTLGGDARKIAPAPTSREANTIPKDTNPNN